MPEFVVLAGFVCYQFCMCAPPDDRSLVEHRKEFLLLHWFHQVMQRGYFIPFRYVIGKAGNEHDLHRFIFLPDLLGKGNTIHCAYLDIQKQNIPQLIFGVAEQQALRRNEPLHSNIGLPILRPSTQNTLYIFCINNTIINNCNPIGHVFTFFQLNINPFQIQLQDMILRTLQPDIMTSFSCYVEKSLLLWYNMSLMGVITANAILWHGLRQQTRMEVKYRGQLPRFEDRSVMKCIMAQDGDIAESSFADQMHEITLLVFIAK